MSVIINCQSFCFNSQKVAQYLIEHSGCHTRGLNELVLKHRKYKLLKKQCPYIPSHLKESIPIISESLRPNPVIPVVNKHFSKRLRTVSKKTQEMTYNNPLKKFVSFDSSKCSLFKTFKPSDISAGKPVKTDKNGNPVLSGILTYDKPILSDTFLSFSEDFSNTDVELSTDDLLKSKIFTSKQSLKITETSETTKRKQLKSFDLNENDDLMRDDEKTTMMPNNSNLLTVSGI